jgi:hypothetical protein
MDPSNPTSYPTTTAACAQRRVVPHHDSAGCDFQSSGKIETLVLLRIDIPAHHKLANLTKLMNYLARWRNGSASDSRSHSESPEGWAFKSPSGQNNSFFAQIMQLLFAGLLHLSVSHFFWGAFHTVLL